MYDKFQNRKGGKKVLAGSLYSSLVMKYFFITVDEENDIPVVKANVSAVWKEQAKEVVDS